MLRNHWRGVLACLTFGLGMASLMYVLGPQDWYEVGINTSPTGHLGFGDPTYVVEFYRGPAERIMRTILNFFFWGGVALFFFVVDARAGRDAEE